MPSPSWLGSMRTPFTEIYDPDFACLTHRPFSDPRLGSKGARRGVETAFASFKGIPPPGLFSAVLEPVEEKLREVYVQFRIFVKEKLTSTPYDLRQHPEAFQCILPYDEELYEGFRSFLASSNPENASLLNLWRSLRSLPGLSFRDQALCLERSTALLKEHTGPLATAQLSILQNAVDKKEILAPSLFEGLLSPLSASLMQEYQRYQMLANKK